MAQFLSLWKGLIDLKPTIAQVKADVAARYGMTPKDLDAVRARGRLGAVRQEAMAEAYERCGKSNRQIAYAFGVTNHATVIEARRRHKERLSA